jgi:hypothetical protein
MNHIHRVAMDERIDHFPSSGTMCTGSVSKDGLFNTSTALVIESSGTLWVMEKSKAFQSL